MDYFELSRIVLELIPFFGSLLGTKHNMGFQQPQGVYFLLKYDGLSKLVAFAKNCGILQTRRDQIGDHVKMNFDYFQIQK